MNKTKSKRLILLLLCAGVCLLGACSRKVTPHTVGGFYFDTYVSLTLYDDGPAAEAAAKDFLSECARYDALFSVTAEGSDIQRINQAGGAAVSVSEDTIRVLQIALDICAKSHGAANPAIGAVSSLWDFQHPEDAALPDASALREALQHTDPAGIRIDGTEVTLSDPAMRLDLGFIAKGYIADRLKERLLADGITSGILNLGGNVVVLGYKPDNTSYTVGIEKPFAQGEALYTIAVSDTSVVTSGVYERCFTIDDHLYHHILDPKTGYSVENDLYSVTIVCADSVTADALSTACFVLGLQDGMELIESTPDAEALFLDRSLQTHASSGFPAIQRR